MDPVTMQLINLPPPGPILLASQPTPLERPGRRRQTAALPEEQEYLAGLLAQKFLGDFPVHLHLTQGPLGQPQLHLYGAPGPAISFSRGGGRLWAGLAAAGTNLGIDVAAPEEFAGSYPFHKVFADREWDQALAFAGGTLIEAAALLWSVKEAAVKAAGCAYHFFGPRQVRVDLAAHREPDLFWEAWLPPLPPDRLGAEAPAALAGVSRRLNRVWLSLAFKPMAEGQENARAA